LLQSTNRRLDSLERRLNFIELDVRVPSAGSGSAAIRAAERSSENLRGIS
jgi:hypothetical protein